MGGKFDLEMLIQYNRISQSRARKQTIKSLRDRSIRINEPVVSNSSVSGIGNASTSNSNSESCLVSSTVVEEDPVAQNYAEQLKLYNYAKKNDVDGILNFFAERNETLQELASVFIYQTVSPLNNTLLHVAASFGSQETVQLIADDLTGPSICTRTNSRGDTALHVAAKAGHVSSAITLVRCGFESSYSSDDDEAKLSPRDADYDRSLLLRLKNEEGNTALHEALINSHTELAQALIEADPEVSLYLNKESKSPFYLAAEAMSLTCVYSMLGSTRKVNPDERLKGKSPIHAVILSAAACESMERDEPRLTHLRDEEERTALHMAASVGILEVVRCLLGKCGFALVQRDKSGFFPIHMAAIGGHVAVIQELLFHCPDPGEMLATNLQNLLHVAAKSGAFNVVSYVLKNPALEMLINQRDKDGNTPLHLATINGHPNIVSALTWDERVDLKLVNNERLTAFDVAERHIFMDNASSFRKKFTWLALKAAGAPRASTPRILNGDRQFTHPETSTIDYRKDRVNTLLLVSTLVITITFAAGFTMPGGYNDYDPDHGMATMLGHNAFCIFIFCDTISMYSSIIVAVSLIWAQLGDNYLMTAAPRLALPLMGIALIMMGLAFTAGVYLVVSKLTWLGIAIIVMGLLFLLVILLLVFPFFVPVWSSNRILRRICYYPFHILIQLTRSWHV